MDEVDYIIVGQGLAGTILGYTFLKRGKKIKIIDEPSFSSCSRVAAGNYNPIVFKRLVKSWKADEVIPFADNFFLEAEKFLRDKIFWKKEVMKIFANENEKWFWEKKTLEDNKYLTPAQNNLIENPKSLVAPFGFGLVKDAGKIYSARFIELFRNYFSEKKILQEEKFNFSKLKRSGGQVEYENSIAKKIIFCEGWKALGNPYFSYLPFKPAKGELLILAIEDFNCEKIIHKNGYLYSIGNKLFVAGSTYEWKELDDIPTEKGKSAIIEKLKKIIQIPFKIVGHVAGVRPSTKDRRPFIGLHPAFNEIGIFNGFGTKAVMLAPYFANQLYNYLEFNSPLDMEVNICRFPLP